MRRIAYTLIVAASVLATTSATGAPKLISKSKVLDDFAACVAKQHNEAAKKFMATEVGSKEEIKAVRSLTQRSESCLAGREVLSMHTGQIRGSIAQALLSNDEIRIAIIRSRAPVPATRIAKSEGRTFVYDFANCIAEVAPKDAIELIRTERASAAERAAAIALVEPMKACMPEDTAYRLNIPDLRNHIADALYRMSGPANA